MHVIIDCRFAFCSGIGRYIREVVPRILRFEGHSFTVILRREDEDTSFGRACVGAHVRRMFSTAAMYSLQEQVELPWRTPPGDVFWAMHYDAPCFPLRTHYRIVTIHDMCHLAFQQDMPWFKKCYAQWFMYAASHFYDKILTVSHFSKQEILKYEGVAEDKVVVTGCAVERMRYHPHRDLSQERKVRERYGLPKEFFLFVGNGKPHKNLEALLQAYARFHGACATVPALVIVGGFQPLEGNAVRQRLSENQGLSMVHFVGAVEELELPMIYRMAHALFFPSLYEGFGLPLLEAMACGCPVFTANVASMPEVCGAAAGYFDPMDVEDIVRAMGEALEKDRGRVAKGLERVHMYSWDRVAEVAWGSIVSLTG